MIDAPRTPAATSGVTTSDAELRAVVLDQLAHIAPELDRATLRPDVALREQVDLDSMDFLNFMIGLSESLGVEVPDADYRELSTLDSCVRYLAAHGAHKR